MRKRYVVSLPLSLSLITRCVDGDIKDCSDKPSPAFQDHNCVQQLKEHLLSQCKLHSNLKFEQLSTLLSDPDRPIGLLISERLLNLPVQIGLLLLQSLLLVVFQLLL